MTEPKLKNLFGHDLAKIIKAASEEFHLPLKSKAVDTELADLNILYKKHWLRYGTLHDIFVAPESIASDLTFRRIGAVIRLADRYILQADKLP